MFFFGTLPYFLRDNQGKWQSLVGATAQMQPKTSLTEEQKIYRKNLFEWAKKTLVGIEITREEIPLPIVFTTTGIKEALNQPHKHYIEKNEAIKDIVARIKNGIYDDKAKDHKGEDRTFYYIDTEIAGEISSIVIKLQNNRASFYGITEKRQP